MIVWVQVPSPALKEYLECNSGYFTVTGKLKIVASSVITAILIIVLGFASVFAFVFMAFDVATTVTTDIGKYERVLKLTGYPNNALIKYFPNKIPGNAKNIVFSYNPACLQGGENFNLKFETHSDSIKNYIDEFSQKAKWIGKSSDGEAEKNGIFLGAFTTLGYTDLPEDKQRNEMIFLAEDW